MGRQCEELPEAITQGKDMEELMWMMEDAIKTDSRILLLSILIGVAAGIVDIIPMIIQKLDKRAIISAFLQYFFVSIIIVNIDLPYIPWWLEGGLISIALALPVVCIVSTEDKKAVPIILTMATILGTLIGIAGHYFS